MAGLCALAFQNIVKYSSQFTTKKIQAENIDKLLRTTIEPNDANNSEELNQLKTRQHLYSLFNSLGNEKALHAETRFGVILLDLEFYRGRYTNKPSDSILDACAIQPFSVPALTGLPLLSPFASDLGNCLYKSYGYQYLPKRHPWVKNKNLNPCEQAKSRGFHHVVVIRKNGDAFEENRLDCEKQ